MMQPDRIGKCVQTVSGCKRIRRDFRSGRGVLWPLLDAVALFMTMEFGSEGHDARTSEGRLRLCGTADLMPCSLPEGRCLRAHIRIRESCGAGRTIH